MAAAASMEASGDDEIVRHSDAEEATDAKNGAGTDEKTMNDDSYESEEEEEDFEDAHSEANEDEEAMPDGDSNADLHALLAYSKTRLEKKTQPPEPTPEEKQEDEKNDGSDHDEQSIHEEAEAEEIPFESAHSAEQPSTAGSETNPAESAPTEEESPPTTEESPDLNMGVSEDLETKKKLADTEEKALADDETDPAYLLKLAEKKVKEAEEKAKMDEEATGNVLKPAVTTTRRSDANSELWALLNYSKMRIETGSTPQLGKKGTSTPTQRDDVSVNSKLSKSSKRSLNSKKSIASKISTSSGPRATTVTVEGLPPRSPEVDNPVSNATSSDADAPVPNVTSGDASVDGSVSMANSVEEDEESRSSRSDDEDESSDEEEEEEEEEDDDELPSFLKDDEDDVDPEEARKLYEEAKFKAASILSVSEEKLTDVQMLQAIAIAEEAARTGEEKFSTKRSLFKLSEAKIEDLKSFLDFGENKEKASGTPTNTSSEKEPVGWGIGRGRLVKKVGSIFSDFREKCDELDEKKRIERKGKPSNTELLDAAMVDIKKQIDELTRKKTGS
eukprot:scaffold1136_cov141-Skeletonema_menzelii.AAC.3